MTVGELRKLLASYQDEQIFVIEQLPNFNMKILPLTEAVVGNIVDVVEGGSGVNGTKTEESREAE